MNLVSAVPGRAVVADSFGRDAVISANPPFHRDDHMPRSLCEAAHKKKHFGDLQMPEVIGGLQALAFNV